MRCNRILNCLAFFLGIVVRSSAATTSQDCVDALYEADNDGNFLLTRSEYVTFIAIRSKWTINVTEYEDLPLPLVTNFNFAACMCSQYYLTETPNCCVGDRARIDLHPSTSPLAISNSFFTFCMHIDIAIGLSVTPNYTTNRPTSSPSASTTPDDLYCFTFQYSIVNHAGLDSNDIFNGGKNSLRTGLEIATQDVTEKILNVTNLHRLGLFTETYSVSILSIISDRFCKKKSPQTECAIVLTRVCLIIEKTIQHNEVKQFILAGIEKSISNGEFQYAIPKDYQLPK